MLACTAARQDLQGAMGFTPWVLAVACIASDASDAAQYVVQCGGGTALAEHFSPILHALDRPLALLEDSDYHNGMAAAAVCVHLCGGKDAVLLAPLQNLQAI